MAMIAVKVTTESGYDWSTHINGTIKYAKKYFMGNMFDVGVYPVEKMEKVVKVERV